MLINAFVGLFSARVTLLERTIAQGGSICPSVCPSHFWATSIRFKISKYIAHVYDRAIFL